MGFFKLYLLTDKVGRQSELICLKSINQYYQQSSYLCQPEQ